MSKLNGFILDPIIRKIAPFFLYIFIAADAAVPAVVLKKRAKQIEILQLIDKFALFNNYNSLVNLVREGILKRYNKTPEQVLNILYYNQSAKVSGVGTTTGSHFDGTNWVDDVTGDVLAESESVLAYSDAQANYLSSEGQTSNLASGSDVYTQIQEIVNWVITILHELGITKKTSTLTDATLANTDFAGTSTADISTYLPWVVVAAIIVTALTDKSKKTKSQSTT